LIVGPSGSGKSTLAREIAMAINCEKRNEGAYPMPCGFCNTCRRIREGNFTDIKYLEKPKDRATIGVEAVKDFREDMFLSATESERKIYIID
jgi:DNA polymerase-3 subunit gamma/tau